MGGTVSLVAALIPEHCTGCSICRNLCPTTAITMVKNPRGKPGIIPVIDMDVCVGCWACEKRCPDDALRMMRHPNPRAIGPALDGVDHARVEEICQKARIQPEQVICNCFNTRAEEVAATIVQGYTGLDMLSRITGIRTSCRVTCTRPLVRLLEAAGYPQQPVKTGWQVMGRRVSVWEIPEVARARYASRVRDAGR